ncbi:colipase [Lissotriton helveticus]
MKLTLILLVVLPSALSNVIPEAKELVANVIPEKNLVANVIPEKNLVANVIPEKNLVANVIPKKNLVPDVSPEEAGLIINLDRDELCMFSFQCKSKCCHRTSGLSLARCAPSSAENQECTPWTIYDVYYKCPCEAGLKCETDRTIIGSITNTDYGLCIDPNGRSLAQQQPAEAPEEA